MSPALSYGRRSARYWHIDGLPETARGMLLVLLATLACLCQMHSTQSASQPGFTILFGGFLLYLFFLERPILGLLKARLTYPRTGYVQPPDVTTFWPRAGRVLLACGYGIVWLEAVKQFGGNPLGPWLAPIAMPVLATALYLANRNSERPYSKRAGLLLGITGLPFLFAQVPPQITPLLPVLLTGAWLVVQGMDALLDYLRANPNPPSQVRA